MASKKISALPTLSSAPDDTIMSVVSGGVNYGITKANFRSNSLNINNSFDGQTLTTQYDIYYIDNSESFTIYLPPVTEMTNRQLIFITTHNADESWLNISTNDGSQMQAGDQNSYNMGGPSTVAFLCDGTNWWILYEFN